MNVEKIVEELKKGNLVITPTDTVYGILADANNPQAIEKVFETKKRDVNKPLLLIVDSIDMLQEYTKEISNLEMEIINKYLPGKLTIILTKNEKVNNKITGGNETIGIRIPKNNDLLEIIKKVGNPLISTSANIAGNKTVTSISEIEQDLLEKISYIEDGGTIKTNPSSIIKIENNKIYILRKGDIAKQIIKDYEIQIEKKKKHLK